MAKNIRKNRYNGEGTYYKQPNDIWQYKITVGRDDSGKLIRKTFYSLDRNQAKEKADVWISKNKGMSFIVSPDTKFKEWLEVWLKNTKKGMVKRESSYQQLEKLIEHIPDKLKDKKVSAISPIELQSFLNTFAKDKSKSYTDKMYTLLRTSLAAAHDNGLCQRNPAISLITPPKKQAPREAYTPEEVNSIIEFAGRYPDTVKHKIMKAAYKRTAVGVITLLYTGMRRGELLGLQWNDITKDKISIRRAVYINQGVPVVTENEAKTEKSLRDIPIPEFLYEMICTLPKEGLFIFCANNGNIMHPRNFSRGYETFIRHLQEEQPDFRYLSLHSCRHTYATLALSGGADVRVVQTLLGHTNINTTALYTHPDFVQKQNALSGIMTLIGDKTGKTLSKTSESEKVEIIPKTQNK